MIIKYIKKYIKKIKKSLSKKQIEILQILNLYDIFITNKNITKNDKS